MRHFLYSNFWREFSDLNFGKKTDFHKTCEPAE